MLPGVEDGPHRRVPAHRQLHGSGQEEFLATAPAGEDKSSRIDINPRFESVPV